MLSCLWQLLSSNICREFMLGSGSYTTNSNMNSAKVEFLKQKLPDIKRGHTGSFSRVAQDD